MLELDKFRKIDVKKREFCIICGFRSSIPVIKLPCFPLTEIYVDYKVDEKIGCVDQEFHFCKNCGHGQIAQLIDHRILYGSHYRTRTTGSLSATSALDVFLEFIDGIIKDRPIKKVLEIGCNDLYFLKKIKNRADILYGIDPIWENKGTSFCDEKIRLIGDFFESVDLKQLEPVFDIVLSSHTLEHVANPKRLLESLIDKNDAHTLFFFQFPGLEALIQDCRFDQVFHQHLNYFSIPSILYMLDDIGAELIGLKKNPYHWGSLMIAFKKKTKTKKRRKTMKSGERHLSAGLIRQQYQIFKDGMNVTSRRLKALDGQTIYGYGAALMLPVLDYHLEGLRELKYIIDDDLDKKDLFYLNFPVQIKSPAQIKDIKDTVILVTAINSVYAARAIISRLIKVDVRQIITPMNII